ncbi:hypothetical protein [Dehalococcoides mccartyi]|nr:hypothetical protein [Dehalococcoides mccartyi]
MPEQTNLIEPVLTSLKDSLLHASGITEDQARICLLYALCTYRTDLNTVPILAVIGTTGTGKSRLLDQLSYLVRNPRIATATSYASMRDEMENCQTYIVHEADQISETLLQRRTDRREANISHQIQREQGQWTPFSQNIFGSTILARRTPFRDAAVRNRAIVINTRINVGNYNCQAVQDLESVFTRLSIQSCTSMDRVTDTWRPLSEIANAIEDPEWAASINRAITAERTIFRSGQDYDPQTVTIHALDRLTWLNNHRNNDDVDLPILTEEIRTSGGVRLTNQQVEGMCITLGFNVTYTHGIKRVRSDITLLESLLATNN